MRLLLSDSVWMHRGPGGWQSFCGGLWPHTVGGAQTQPVAPQGPEPARLAGQPTEPADVQPQQGRGGSLCLLCLPCLPPSTVFF